MFQSFWVEVQLAELQDVSDAQPGLVSVVAQSDENDESWAAA